MTEHEQIFKGIANDNEAVLDLLLVCANKPVNYAGLNNFSCNDLWKVAKSFAVARNHSQEAINAAIMTLQEAAGFDEKMPELIGFAGVELPQKGLAGAQLYYAREEHFQDLVYKLAKERIEQSVYETLGFPIEKTRQRECQIAKIYLHYLEDLLFHNQFVAGIAIDVDKFKHYYDSIYGKEMPPTITRKLIIEVLQMARLGYEHDGKFYPFWYTVRGDAGRRFRQTLSESIAARIS